MALDTPFMRTAWFVSVGATLALLLALVASVVLG
jgi:hypothetical protein